MPGYAYPVGADEAATGNAGTTSVLVDQASTPVTIFTATSKTKIISILLHNGLGTIIPVTLYIHDGSVNRPLAQVRVHKWRYALQQLVSGDARVETEVLKKDTLTEFVLMPGDSLKASCRYDDTVTVTATYIEGIS